MKIWSQILRALAALVLLAYPGLVYFGMSSGSPRQVSIVLLLVLAPAIFFRLNKNSNQGVRILAVAPLSIIAILSLTALVGEQGYILITPVATNSMLLIAFGSTLRRSKPNARIMPMIERFARMQESELSDDQQAWCRMWTWIWCIFFVINGTTAMLLATWGTIKWWALYNGLLCYGLIGLLFAAEWLLRRYRFREIFAERARARAANPDNMPTRHES